jgi:hypothetical protein
MLVDGEQQLGRYQAAVLRRRDGNWTATVPPLNIVATNYRLILWPQTLKPYPPASIPCTFIREAGDVVTDQGRALRLRLETGHRIYLMVGSNNSHSLRGDIRHMVRPPRTTIAFAANVAKNEILRLIGFFGAENDED